MRDSFSMFRLSMIRLLPAALALVLAGLYAPAFGRYFVSEDFLILRRLARPDFWAVAAESFAGPWLGVTFVQFYRPLSSLLLQVEVALFGVQPAPYLVTHLAVHAFNAWLLARWLRRFAPARPPAEAALAALVFACYPLHPNTVVFVASFATLFAATFLLLALNCHEDKRPWAATACVGAALLCYEQAVFFPVWLLLHAAWDQRTWRPAALKNLLAPLGVLALYLVGRRLAMGASLGGYATFHERLSAPWELVRPALENICRLFWPSYGRPLDGVWLAVAAAGLLTIVQWAWRRRKSEPEAATLALSGLAQLGLALAPFLYVGVVPGNGRYFYLASIGVVLTLLGVGQLLANRAPRLPSAVLGVALLAALWLARPVIAAYGEAGTLSRQIQQQLLQARAGQDGKPLFVAGRPTFVFRSGVPVAQVFHWGLGDALLPPFVPLDARVFPVPELSDAELAPLAPLGLVRWSEGGLTPIVAAIPSLLDSRMEGANGWTLRFAPASEARYRLLVSARGGVLELDLGPGAGGRACVPEPFATSMRRLYPGDPIYVWLDARTAGGAHAASRVWMLPGG
jgi:hypothetical protein